MVIINGFNQYSNNKLAICDDGRILYYSDFNVFDNQFKAKTKTRSLAFCFCKNTPASLFGYLGMISNKVVPIMLDAKLEAQLRTTLFEIYTPTYIWLPSDMVGEFKAGTEVFSWESYTLLTFDSSNSKPLHPDLALLFATSGSTGSPKLVRISYENLLSNANSIAEYLSIDENERPITALPMNYSFGLSIINSHLIKGATLLLTDKSVMEKGFWELLKSGKATSLSGVPYTFEMLSMLRFFKMELPHLKTLTQAGGKLNLKYTNEFAAFCHTMGKRFFVMYGQTEATARMAYLPNEYAVAKAGSMGIAIPGGEFWLIDHQKQIIQEPEVVGELVYRGKNVSMGYAEGINDLAKADENNGILYTGDMAKRDAEGFYYIVGRNKRFIKLFGNRVNLDETEQILKNMVPECACVGVDDQMVIYITEPTQTENVINYISGKTGINPKAFSVKCIDTIPKNPSGKTLYAQLANQ